MIFKIDWSNFKSMQLISDKKRGRPPLTERSHQDTRGLLIQCGLALLTEQGFSACGIAAVLKAAQVPKGSFYHYFSSKEDFALAVLDAYHAFFSFKLDKYLKDAMTPPLERLANFMASAARGMARHGFQRGCLAGNLGQEAAVLSDTLNDRVEAILQCWEKRVAECLEQAQQQGQLAAHKQCQELAHCFWIGWEGAVQRARIQRSQAPLESYGDFFISSLA